MKIISSLLISIVIIFVYFLKYSTFAKYTNVPFKEKISLFVTFLLLRIKNLIRFFRKNKKIKNYIFFIFIFFSFLLYNRLFMERAPKNLDDITLIFVILSFSVLFLHIFLLFRNLKNLLALKQVTEPIKKNKTVLNKIFIELFTEKKIKMTQYLSKKIEFFLLIKKNSIDAYCTILRHFLIRMDIIFNCFETFTEFLKNKEKLFFFIFFLLPRAITVSVFFVEIIFFHQIVYFYKILWLLLIPLIAKIVRFTCFNIAAYRLGYIKDFFHIQTIDDINGYTPYKQTDFLKFELKKTPFQPPFSKEKALENFIYYSHLYVCWQKLYLQEQKAFFYLFGIIISIFTLSSWIYIFCYFFFDISVYAIIFSYFVTFISIILFFCVICLKKLFALFFIKIFIPIIIFLISYYILDIQNVVIDIRKNLIYKIFSYIDDTLHDIFIDFVNSKFDAYKLLYICFFFVQSLFLILSTFFLQIWLFFVHTNLNLYLFIFFWFMYNLFNFIVYLIYHLAVYLETKNNKPIFNIKLEKQNNITILENKNLNYINVTPIYVSDKPEFFLETLPQLIDMLIILKNIQEVYFVIKTSKITKYFKLIYLFNILAILCYLYI